MEAGTGHLGGWRDPDSGRVAEIIFTSCSCRTGLLIASSTDQEYITIFLRSVINSLVEFSSTARLDYAGIRKVHGLNFQRCGLQKSRSEPGRIVHIMCRVVKPRDFCFHFECQAVLDTERTRQVERGPGVICDVI